MKFLYKPYILLLQYCFIAMEFVKHKVNKLMFDTMVLPTFLHGGTVLSLTAKELSNCLNLNSCTCNEFMTVLHITMFVFLTRKFYLATSRL